MSKKQKKSERTEQQLQFYSTAAWQHCRALAMSRDQFLCQDCKAKGLITAAEEVHHIVAINSKNVHDPSVTLNLDNLVSLCSQCHVARHTKTHRRYTVDEFGHVTITD